MGLQDDKIQLLTVLVINTNTRQSVIAVNNCVLVLGSRGTHIRLLTISRLLDLCPAALSYSLKEKFMLIGFPVRSHVIFA